jgi:hypothetical protein
VVNAKKPLSSQGHQLVRANCLEQRFSGFVQRKRSESGYQLQFGHLTLGANWRLGCFIIELFRQAPGQA